MAASADESPEPDKVRGSIRDGRYADGRHAADPPLSGPAVIPLPIDPSLPDIVEALRAARAVVVEAPPGAGKTTRVPRALLDAGAAAAGEILVVQPRRLPAQLAARRVADELGEEAGATVGYTVRFEDRSGPATRVRFVTEGILARRLLADPELRGVGTVILDEFHERHVATDLALALLRALQAGARPDLRVCVMSATLDAGPICDFLGGCPRVRTEGRAFDVAIDHLAEPDARPLHEQVAAAARRALRDGPPGDLLVFLPGAGEIRRAQEALAPLAETRDLLVVALHGEMSLADQNRAVRPADRRKVILSTNVAETSVTIDGVTVVIDGGVARVAATSPWSGLPTLALAKISQASAIQRAGRAGRTRPGVAYRLYTRHDFELRRRHDLPEIARTDLCETVLALAAAGVGDPAAFAWFDAPPAAALGAATELLARLGAVETAGAAGQAGDGARRLTALGRRMLRFPVHPRLGRLLCEAERRGASGGGCVAAALIAERDIRERSRASFTRAGAGGGGDGRGADLLELVDLFRQAAAARFARDRLRALGLDARAVEQVERARQQLSSLVERPAARASVEIEAEERALQIATLTGFPDRVGRRRADRNGRSRAVVLSGGGSAELGFEAGETLDLLVAIDVEERTGAARPGGAGGAAATIRLSCAIEPEWLLDLFAGEMSETDQLVWNPATDRVDRVSRLSYGAIALEESVTPAPPGPETSRLLAEAVFAHGVDRFDDAPGALAALAARVALARDIAPDSRLPAFDAEALRDVVRAACDGSRGFAELRATGLAARAQAALPPEAQHLLRTLAPESLTLPGGRKVAIHYEAGKPPWIESRLQDFFGMTRSPAVGGGRVPLTLHLLAPNGRPVQVTGDLESFWRQHYPPLRRELGRRYPKHAWPEDGRTATPPAPRPPRPR
jgi:ATP-dependent helicase HrpB